MTTLAKESQKKYLETSIEYLVEYLSISYKELYCSEKYYKNVLIYHALHQNVSMQCILRTYMESLKDASSISGHKSTDILHINALLMYLWIYNENEKTEEINTSFFHFRNYLTAKVPYLLGKSGGRIKSFMSLEAKIRNKIATIEAINNILDNMPNIFIMLAKSLKHLQDEKGKSNISSSEARRLNKIQESIEKFLNAKPSEPEIRAILNDLLEKSKSLTKMIKDIIGYRFILHSINKRSDENEMKNFLTGEFTTEIKNFFWENGYVFDPSGFKNYIAKPKPNRYSSLHFIFEVQDVFLEVQARTWRMHDIAENGDASHDKVYKESNIIYRFLESFFVRDMDEAKKAQLALIGVTEPLDISNRPWCFIPKEELPKTYSQIKEFENKKLLKSAIKNSP